MLIILKPCSLNHFCCTALNKMCTHGRLKAFCGIAVRYVVARRSCAIVKSAGQWRSEGTGGQMSPGGGHRGAPNDQSKKLCAPDRHELPILHKIWKFCVKFGHLILRKITKFVATRIRCQLLSQKCTKIDSSDPFWGSLQRSSRARPSSWI